jgi:hypothetical protein
MATFDLRSIKRQKITIASLIQVIAMALALQWPWQGIALIPLLIVSYLAVIWILDFDLKVEEWLVIPLYALILCSLTFIWLEWYVSNPIIQWGSIVTFGLAMYGMLLTLNILNVATVRTLPLIRQALSLISMAGVAGLFTSYYLLLTLQPTMWEWVSGSMAATFLLAWPLVWSSRLGRKGTSLGSDITWTLLIMLVAGELAAIVGFWPVSFMTGLFMAAVVSMAIGLVHYQRTRQITQAVQWQYAGIGVMLVAVYYLVSRWT